MTDYFCTPYKSTADLVLKLRRQGHSIHNCATLLGLDKTEVAKLIHTREAQDLSRYLTDR